MMKNKIHLKNKKAYHNFEFIELLVCGIVLQGPEIKSIRESKVSFGDSFCFFSGTELWLKNLHIDPYENASYNQGDPLRDRKLLVTKKQAKSFFATIKMGGLTMVPTRMFITEEGFCKVEIALAKGKKEFDKRNELKKKDLQRENQQKIRM